MSGSQLGPFSITDTDFILRAGFFVYSMIMDKCVVLSRIKRGTGSKKILITDKDLHQTFISLAS